MGALARLVGERKSADPLQVWADLLRAGRKSKAGPTVTLDNALKVAVWFACCKVLSQGVAQVPFKLFRETEEGNLSKIVPARNHPLYPLMTVAPNAWSTSFEFRETFVLHALHGNGYAFINRVMGGKIAELILLDPSRVRYEQLDDYTLQYKVTGKSGAVQIFPQSAIWHLRGPSWSGIGGIEVLSLAREALGLAMAAEETHAKLHANSLRPSGVYSVENTLNPTQHEQLRTWIKAEQAEADGGILIVDRGASFSATVMNGLDAQHLETRRFQIEEVCRYAGVMPIMVGYSDKAATYASSEQMFLAHVIHTLMPWYARIEQSADLNLLTPADRAAGLYFKFIAAGLMRGASKDRGEYFAKALGAGGSPAWMTQDEVRGLDELNPFGGTAGVLPVATNVPKTPDRDPT